MNLWVRKRATQKTEYIILFTGLLLIYPINLEDRLCVFCVREVIFRQTIFMMIFVSLYRIRIRDEKLNLLLLLLM